MFDISALLRFLETGMKRLSASPIIFFLAVWVVALQLAGSSPLLHGMLHGQQMQTHTCPDHSQSPGDTPGGEEGCGDGCVVNLLNGGITLSQAIVLEAIAPVFLSVNDDGGSQKLFPESVSVGFARAPPVL